MRDCVRCSRPVDGPVCSACGYSDLGVSVIAPDVIAARKRFIDSAPRDVGATPQDCVIAGRKLARKLKFGDRDPRRWARKILERSAAGDYYPLIAIDNAKEALGIVKVADDEADEERMAMQAEVA